MREDQSQRHELLGLAARYLVRQPFSDSTSLDIKNALSSVTKHDTLITSTVALEVSVIKTLGNIGRLLLNGDQNVAGLEYD